MDKQIVFNTVVNHLRAQGRRASLPNISGCFYRLEVGGEILKCAVGCLIKDEFYLPVMENCTVTAMDMDTEFGGLLSAGKRAALLRAALAMSIPHFDPSPRGPDVAFLKELQVIHDTSTNPNSWEPDFKKLAEQYGLVYTPKVRVDGKIDEYPGWD